MQNIPNNELGLKLANLVKASTMFNNKHLLSTIFLSISFSLIGCSDNSQKNGTPSLFETKIEAEKAAKDFSCTGAHKMGDKWMPCNTHSFHEDKENNKSNNEHQHHH